MNNDGDSIEKLFYDLLEEWEDNFTTVLYDRSAQSEKEDEEELRDLKNEYIQRFKNLIKNEQ